ncbi:hypothetical protein V8E36_007733, partial [Tilletia maclaganii]
NVDLIGDVAERAGVRQRLPESLAASKQTIIFIGPPGTAMRFLDDNMPSTIVAHHAAVPDM